MIGGVMQCLWILIFNANERIREGVERFLALGLGRLNHQRLGNDEREIDGRSVIAVIQETLADVHGADLTLASERLGTRHELMHAVIIAVGYFERAFRSAQQVVGIQHGDLAHLAQAIGPERANVEVATQQNADVAEERTNATDRLGPVVIEVICVAFFTTSGAGRYGIEHIADGDGTGSRTAGAVGSGEGLVDVVVHHVCAEVARPRDAEDGVHVGAVKVDEAALLVHELGDRRDLRIEQAQRIRIGDHEDGGAVVELRVEVVEVDETLRVALDADGVEPGDGCAGGIGAVGAVGDQDAFAFGFAAILEVSGRDEQSGQLSLSSRRGLQGTPWRPAISAR